MCRCHPPTARALLTLRLETPGGEPQETETLICPEQLDRVADALEDAWLALRQRRQLMSTFEAARKAKHPYRNTPTRR